MWDPTDAEGAPLAPLPTPEHKRPSLASIYALSKYSQERMCLLMGEAYAIPTVVIFEDGAQRRDFVDVRDVARACRLALEQPRAAGHAINVGSGESRSILEVADSLASVLGCEGIRPEIGGRYRTGDVRHCFADLELARDVLGFSSEIGFDDGLVDLAEWLASQVAVDRVDQATEELRARGLVA